MIGELTKLIEADFLRQIFTDVTPGYHMNKTHWNTIILGGDVSEVDGEKCILCGKCMKFCPKNAFEKVD